jgi:hypothetical protein
MRPSIQSSLLAFRKKPLMSLYVLFMFLCGIGGAHVWFSTALSDSVVSAETNGPERIASSREEARQDNSAPEQIKVIRFTIREEGFDPPEMTLSAGRYLLVVNNRSESKSISLRLDSGSQRIMEGRMASGKLKWRSDVQLFPGEYLLSEANHPRWRVRILVTSD